MIWYTILWGIISSDMYYMYYAETTHIYNKLNLLSKNKSK